MKMKRICNYVKWLVLYAIVIVTGCNAPTDLEIAARKIKPGMYKTNVTAIFTDFKMLYEGKECDARIPRFETIFNTNINYGKITSYGLKSKFRILIGPMEYCDIYFDSNDVVIGYCYLRDDGRPVGALSHSR